MKTAHSKGSTQMTVAILDRPTAHERPLTLTEVANALGRGYPYVTRLWAAGKLEGAYKIGRSVVVPPETVAKLLAEQVGEK